MISEKKKRLFVMSGLFFLIALVLCVFATLSPHPIASASWLTLFCCTDMQREGFFMISAILCLMGGYCLASALGM